MIRKIMVWIVLFFMIITTYASIIYDYDFFGVKPIPSAWIGKEFESKESVRLILNPIFYVGNWNGRLVKLTGPWWGKPTNPAENSFYLQDELPPFLKLTFEFYNKNFGLYTEIPVEEEFEYKILQFNDGSNFISNPPYIDLNFPKYAYLYFSNNDFFASIGRFPIIWGDAKYPVHISPTTSLDNITFALKFFNAVYTFHAIASYPLLSTNEYNIQKNYSDQHTAGMYFYEPSKYIFAHRIDFYNSFLKDVQLRIGIGELNVVGGKFPDIIDLNPAVIFHNTYGEGYSNVTGSIDFSLRIDKWLKFYGEFVLDDFKSPTEQNSNYKPGAQAFNIGISVNVAPFELWCEYAESSEWMYVTNYLPYLRINVRQFVIQNSPSSRLLVDYPLGFLYGPDAKLFAVGLNTSIFDISFNIEYNHLIKGQVNDNGVVRWKWFWDSWPGNVAESGATVPPKTVDAVYDILKLNLKWQNFEAFGKIINFSNYILGVKALWKM